MNLNAVERYASSVFAELIKLGKDEVVDFINESAEFLKLIDESFELKEFFASPAFTESEKKEFFGFISEKTELSDHFRTLFTLLIEHRRTLILPEIKQAMEKHLDAYLGIEEAVVFTPFEFDKNELDSIRKKVSVLTGNKDIRLVQKIDPRLSGGARIKVGDTIYDGSFSSMMKNLKKSIMEVC